MTCHWVTLGYFSQAYEVLGVDDSLGNRRYVTFACIPDQTSCSLGEDRTYTIRIELYKTPKEYSAKLLNS